MTKQECNITNSCVRQFPFDCLRARIDITMGDCEQITQTIGPRNSAWEKSTSLMMETFERVAFVIGSPRKGVDDFISIL